MRPSSKQKYREENSNVSIQYKPVIQKKTHGRINQLEGFRDGVGISVLKPPRDCKINILALHPAVVT
jgi:hypothetical protein